jgi:hypothetical protein
MTTANPNIFDTNVLVGLVPNLKVAQTFLLDKFFPGIVESSSEYVSIDIDVGKRRLAPFCSPLVEGRMVESRLYNTNIFKPPYIKDKRAPDLRKPIRRQMGERIGGELTAAEREMVNIQFEMTDQIDMIKRRLEWMAAQELLGGTVTIVGDGYPTTTIDFGRDAALTVALSGGATWDNASPSTIPSDCIEQWQNIILKKSGAVATDIVFTTTAWNCFKKDPEVKATWLYPGNGGDSRIQVGAEIVRGAILKGTWGGYRLWLYNDWFVNETTNVETPMLTDGTLLMCGPDLMGTQAFASILDPVFAYGPMAYAPKTWVKEDPAQRFVMMQSAPLVIPSRVNACLSASVAAAVMS